MNTKPINVPYEDFAKLDIRVGTIVHAENIPKSNKLLKLEVRFGETTRTIVAGIAEHYQPVVLNMSQLQVVAVLNLAPRVMFGIESCGMLLAGRSANGEIVLVSPNGTGSDKTIAEGSEVG